MIFLSQQKIIQWHQCFEKAAFLKMGSVAELPPSTLSSWLGVGKKIDQIDRPKPSQVGFKQKINLVWLIDGLVS